MTDPYQIIEGRAAAAILLIADHGSNHVPTDIDLGIAPALLDLHIAVDIGSAALTKALAARLDAPAILAAQSRLVVDLNRERDNPGAIPIASDGHAIAGNALETHAREARLRRFWDPYHAAIAALVDRLSPALLVSVHSFTPRLETAPPDMPDRPWQVGILYNHDERAVRLALPLLEARGIVAGDNEPYSGRLLNATMNRHAEARGLPYLGLEVRNDLIADDAGVEQWAGLLAPVITATLAGLR